MSLLQKRGKYQCQSIHHTQCCKGSDGTKALQWIYHRRTRTHRHATNHLSKVAIIWFAVSSRDSTTKQAVMRISYPSNFTCWCMETTGSRKLFKPCQQVDTDGTIGSKRLEIQGYDYNLHCHCICWQLESWWWDWISAAIYSNNQDSYDHEMQFNDKQRFWCNWSESSLWTFREVSAMQDCNK